jgi:hypothetical protein
MQSRFLSHLVLISGVRMCCGNNFWREAAPAWVRDDPEIQLHAGGVENPRRGKRARVRWLNGEERVTGKEKASTCEREQK